MCAAMFQNRCVGVHILCKVIQAIADDIATPYPSPLYSPWLLRCLI